MTVRPIVITGEPVLHRRAEPVTKFDEWHAPQSAPARIGPTSATGCGLLSL